MSLIRLNPPGQPIRYIELGPARARLSTNQYGSMGGQLELPPRRKLFSPPAVMGPREPLARCHQRFASDTLVCGRPRHDILSPHRSVQACERDRAKRKGAR
jgi:hypothetical protein